MAILNNKNITMRLVLVMIFFLTSTACPVYDPPIGTLSIHNYTDSAVYIYRTCSDSLNEESELKLFLIDSTDRIDAKGNKIPPIYSPNYRINAYSYGTLYGFGSKNNRTLECKKKRLTIYFIREQTMKLNKWEKIASHQLYETKMTFSESQLDSMNWKIRYME